MKKIYLVQERLWFTGNENPEEWFTCYAVNKLEDAKLDVLRLEDNEAKEALETENRLYSRQFRIEECSLY